MCNPYLYRGAVQKRARTLTWEVHTAPDPCGNTIQLTLQQLNNHPVEACHCVNTVKFPGLNGEEGINTSKWKNCSCTLRCTEPAFRLCSLHKLCSHDVPSPWPPLWQGDATNCCVAQLCGKGMKPASSSAMRVGKPLCPQQGSICKKRPTTWQGTYSAQSTRGAVNLDVQHIST